MSTPPALRTDELLSRHITIMDKYEPVRKVAMVVDERGTWHAVEDGTNPGFLFQQNTLRDAMAAALTFDVFHRYADRIRMANIAQTVNVLQAMVLTEGEKTVLTATYHVFDMYQVHQDATALPPDLHCGEYACGQDAIAALSATASRDEAGRVHLCVTNVDPNNGAEVSCEIRGMDVPAATGTILTADEMTAHNGFGRGEGQRVRPEAFGEVTLAGSTLTIAMPAKSIVALELS